MEEQKERNYSLLRFIDAQDYPPEGGTSYAKALEEMRNGVKATHWMWWVFPQLEGFGHSPYTKKYGVADLAEAVAYLKNETLYHRMSDILNVMFEVKNRTYTSIGQIMGNDTDSLKFRSSMTLFWVASRQIHPSGDPLFKKAIDVFCWGSFCPNTLAMLRNKTIKS